MKYIFLVCLGAAIWASYANIHHIHQRALGALVLIVGVAAIVKRIGDIE